MPDEYSQTGEDTRKLRARFPRWGILFDPLESVWVAVRGKKTLVAASTPETLTERVEAAAQRALMTGACRYKSVKSILEKSLDREPLIANDNAGAAPLSHDNVRGAEYFQ